MGQPILRRDQQKLNAIGYVIVPTSLSELVNSSGTLRPDEEVDLHLRPPVKL